MKTYFKKLKEHFEDVMKTKTSPNSIALGFSIGTLIGTLPIPFIDIFIGLVILAVFEKISKYALILSIFIWNPVTKIPIYTLSYKVGDLLFIDKPITIVKFYFLNDVYNYTIRFLVGNIIISILLSVISYFLIYSIIYFIEKDILGWKKKKIIEN